MRKKVLARALGVVVAALVASACSAAPVMVEDASAMVRATPTATPAPTPTETPAPTATPAPSPTATPAPDWNAPPAAAMDAAGLARQLATVEAAIRDPKVSGAELAWMGHLQQLAYSRLADYPDWRDEVLAALPATTRDAVKASLDAGKQLRSMSSVIPRTLPEWKILAPKPVDDLMSFYKEGEEQYGVAWYYLAAIHLVETRMGRIHGLSTAGAQGPMQFIPSTWRQYGKGDVNDDHDAIVAAARYLKAAGAPGDMPRALYAYNHSQAYVNALLGYAAVMKAEPLAYRGYWGWQVYYPTADGPILLPIGWTKPA